MASAPTDPAASPPLDPELAALAAVLDGHIHNAVIVTDADGRVEWTNEGFRDISGYALEEIRGRRLPDVLHGPDTDVAIARTMEERQQQGQGYETSVLNYTKRGMPYWVSLEARPVKDEHGTIRRFVTIAHDITEQRYHEEALESQKQHVEALVEQLREAFENERKQATQTSAVIECIPDGVVVGNARAELVLFNRELEQILGSGPDRGNELGWVEAYGLRRPDGSAPFPEEELPLYQALQGRSADRVEVLAHRPGADEDRLLEVTARPIPFADGECWGVAVVRDITDLRREQQELQEMERQLQQSQKMESLGQLAAGVAHEINTPAQFVSDNTRFLNESFQDLLGPLTRLSDALGKGDEPSPTALREVAEMLDGIDFDYLVEDVPQAIEQSLEGLGRITSIVKAMTEFAHPGATMEATDLNHAVKSTVEVARNEWKYVADLEVTLDAELPLVRCVAGEIKQLVLNLIVNASHAIANVVGDKGSKGRIDVRTQRDGDRVRLEVEDTGCGIAAEHLERVFDPFFTTKPVGKGTGQGLSVAHDVVVRRHGGTIQVRSEVGQGTCFIVHLPIEGVESA